MLLTKSYSLEERKALVSVCTGLERPDLILSGGSIVDVATGEVREVDVVIKGSRIAYVGNLRDLNISHLGSVIDVKGTFITPGFIDPHAHVESTMLTPSAYASLLIPQGTTGAIIDPHEIVNVSGFEGLTFFLKDADSTPFKFYVQAPSCVPSAPGLETSGYIVSSSDIEKLINRKDIWGLGELMDYKKVIEGDVESLMKIKHVYERGGVIDGHSPSLKGMMLQAYISSGIMTDHTSRSKDEVLERLRCGLNVMVQNRPDKDLLRDVIETLKCIDTRRVLLCTDDIEPDEVEDRGHLVSLVREAVDLGLDPVKAVQMVTLNVAEAYRFDSELGMIAPGRYADLIIFNDLKRFDVDKVIMNGRLVASKGKLLIEIPKFDFDRFKNTIKVKAGIKPDDLVIKVELERARALVRVVTVNGELREVELSVSNYKVMSRPMDDIVMLAVVERHGKSGNIGKGFIQGTGLREGAIVTSVSHDVHNLTSIGTSEYDMYLGIKEVERMGGGIVVVMNGKVLASVELPYFGLLTDDLGVCSKVRELRKVLLNMGVKIPLRRLMFLSLPVGLGNFKITDKGLVDYKRGIVLPTIISLSAQ
ncbi:MAG: adenine deaminase [Nitrososphaerota archaeon]|nr:adenine deaminase [Nitrososphaerota archaeon]